MAIKIDGQSNNINDFRVKINGEANSRPVTLLKDKNGNVLYARPGRLDFIQPGYSLPDHIASLAASRASTLEPSASTGTLTDGGRIYHGDVINFTLTPEAYYTATYTSQSTVNFLNNTVVYGTVVVAPVTTSLLYRDLNFTLGDGVEKINARNGSTTYSISSDQTLSVWQGYEWTFGAVRSTYWTNATVSPDSAAKGATTVNIDSSAGRYMRTVSYAGNHFDTLTITYSNSAGDPVTITTNTISGLMASFSAWTGGDIDYSWTRVSYYLAGSGHLDPSEDFRVFAVSAGRKPSTVEVTGTSHRTITATGEKTSSSAALIHSTSDESASWDDYWSGAKVDWTVDYEQYWTGTETGGSVAASEDIRTINVSATKVPRNLYLYPSERATIEAWYDNINPGGGYLKADHADASTDNLWQGGTVSTYSVAADEYCTYSVTTANLGDSENDASITANVTGLTRELTARSGSNIKTFEVTYQDSNFTTHTESITDAVTHTYAAWQGHEITYSCTAYSYYTASVDASGLGIGDNAASIVVEGDLSYRDIVLTMDAGVKSVYFDATGGLPGGDVTYTESGTYSAWQGYEFSLRAFADTYYKSPTLSTNTISKGSATAYVTASVSKKAGTVRVLGSKPTGLSYLNLSSTTIDDQSWTTKATAAATYTLAVWSGAAVDWTAVYLSGYTGDSSGSVAAAEGIRNISWPTPSLQQAVFFYNNSGLAVYVGGTVVMSGNTYAYVFTSSQSVSITCSAAASTSKYVTTSNYGSTYTITTTIGSQYIGTITKSKGPTSNTDTFYKPTYASGAATSHTWEIDDPFGAATITSHNGGPYGWDNITVKIAGLAKEILSADVYYLSVSKLSVS